MIFSTSKTELQKALQKLAKASPLRSTLPSLSCFLIKTKDEKAVLKATDLEITIETTIPTSIEEPGIASLPIKTLLDITNELPETRITFSVNENNNVKITTDLGEYNIMAKPPDEFPNTPKIQNSDKIAIEGKILKEIIDSSSFAVSRDELKPALTGVLFKISSEGVIAVSTDGHRLVKYKRNDYSTNSTINDIIIPKKFLSYLSNHISGSDVILHIEENHMAAKIKDDIISTRIISESFPNYESVIPKDNNKRLTISKEDLLGAIRRVSIFSNKSTHQVVLDLSSTKCSITTEDPEKASKARESIPATYEGDPVLIGYNAEYLKDVITHVPNNEIVIDLNTPVSAALFSSSKKDENIESTMLLMPIRLND